VGHCGFRETRAVDKKMSRIGGSGRGLHVIVSITIWIVLVISVLYVGIGAQGSKAQPSESIPNSAITSATATKGCPTVTPGYAAFFVGPIPATFTLSPKLSLSGPGSIYVGVGVLGGTANIRVSDSLGDKFTHISSFVASWNDEGALFYHDYAAAESGLTISVVFSGGTGNHAVAIAIPIVGTYQKRSLNAVGSWVSATSATSITASVTTPRAGDTVLMFPFDTVGVSLEQGLPTPNTGFANVPNGGASTAALLWEGNDSYGYDATTGSISVTQSGGASGGDIFAIAIAVRP
jgi:hypothetical protein